MKFCWCTVTVDDMDESLKFYTEIVGLTMERKFTAGPGVAIAFLGDEETKVELVCHPAHKVQGNGGDVSLGFEVDSVEEKIKFLNGKGLEVEGPYQPNPHIKYIFAKDPSGVRIQFVENI